MDQTATAVGNSSTPSSGATATTAQADEFVVGAIGAEARTSFDTMAAGASFTLLPAASADTGSSSSSITIYPEYRIVSATGAYTASGTLSSGNSRNWAADIVTYKMVDTTAPTVTINQAVGQADPTSASSISFTATFSEPVTGFATGDVTITGTAGGTKTATVTGGPTIFNVDVTGMTSSGTVIADIAAGVATDSGLNGNTASTSTDKTVQFNLNVAPTATNLSAAESYTEDTALNLIDIVASDVDSANVTATLTLANTSAGSLNTGTSGAVTSTYVAGTGVWTASGAIANVNTLLAGLTFTPAANFNANFNITTSVSDGVAAAVTGSKAMTGTPVNDAPTATNLNAAQTYTEDTALNLTDIVASDVDSAAVTATLTLANTSAGSLNTGTSGAVTSTYVPGTGVWTASGAIANVNALLAGLTFTPAANFNANFNITTSVSDGVAAPVTGSKAMTGTPVNDAPVLDATPSPTLAAENEDAGAPSGAVGTLVSSLVDFASPSGQLDNVTDVDSGAVLGIAVTAADTANGTWFYSLNNGGTWSALGSVLSSSARLLAADSDNRLYFQPNPDFNGNISSAITFRAWDRTSGTDGNTASTSSNGGTTPYSSATDTASLIVISVNDAPTLNAISNPPPIYVDSSAQIVNLSGIGAGDSESQALEVTASSNNTGLIPHPLVTYTSPNSTGSLSYTPVAAASGSAVITVSVRDAGLNGTLPDGDDGTVSRTFTVTVLPYTAWSNNSWLARKPIVIDHTKVSCDLGDFPVLINLASDPDLAAQARSDGFDIVFTLADGTTILSYQREKYTSATGALVAWVKVPALSSTVDTVLYMYYGNPSSSDQQNTTGAVWDSNFRGVWHLSESPAGAAPQMKDSTSLLNNGTANGAMVAGDQQTAQIDGGLHFDGNNDELAMANEANFDFNFNSSLTIEYWAKPVAGDTSLQSIISKMANSFPFTGYEIVHNATGTTGNSAGQIHFVLVNSYLIFAQTDIVVYTTAPTRLNDGNWHHYVWTYNGNGTASGITLYEDGVPLALSVDQNNLGGSSILNNVALHMGSRENGANFYQGLLDEVRVSSAVRSMCWIQTEYNNQKNPGTFYTLGTECTVPTITCPADTTVECGGDTTTTGTGTATSLDGCGTVNIEHSDSFAASCGNAGVITRTWTATDANGASSQCIQTITIQDTTDPLIDNTNKADATVECDGAATGNEDALAAWLANHAGATASDVCGGVTWTHNFTSLSDGCGGTGSALVTFTATDDCNNSSSTTATFTIQDTTDPLIDNTNKADATVECDGAATGNEDALAAWLANHAGATASDVCGGVTWSHNYGAGAGQVSLSDLCGATGAVTVMFTATDDCGNASTTSATFTIQDTTAPTPVCKNIPIVLDENGNATISAVDVDNGSGDICGSVTLGINKSSFDCSNVGDNLVILTVTDACGNQASCTATVTVKRRTTKLVYSGVLTGAYSDCVLVRATLTDIESGTPVALSGQKIKFSLGPLSFAAEGQTDEFGVAVASLGILDLPGNYNIKSEFADNCQFAASSDLDSFIVTGEAVAPAFGSVGLYTGATFFWTTGPSSSTASLALTATIMDDPNDTCKGDIRLARVTFAIRNADSSYTPINGASNLPVGLVDPNNKTVGTASAIVQYNLGTKNVETLNLCVIVTGAYAYNKVAHDQLVSVCKPLAAAWICGSGGVANGTDSSGYIAGAAGQNTSYAFDVTYTQKGTNPKGKVWLNFVSNRKPDGTVDPTGQLHTYQVRSTAITGLGADATKGTASFTSKANIIDITDPANQVGVESGAVFLMDITDGSKATGADKRDKIGLTLQRKAGGVWFSLQWDGTKTIQKAIIAGGEISVK